MKTTLLRKCFKFPHTQLQGIESISKVIWIVNHRNKFIARLHLYIIFVIFLDIDLKAMRGQSTSCTDDCR